MPAGGVLVGGVVGLILALLLNAEALLRDAEQQPFGTGRDISVAVWGPVERAASALRLTLPRQWADRAIGRDVGAAQFDLSAVEPQAEGEPGGSVTIDGVQRIEIDDYGDDAADGDAAGDGGEPGAGAPTVDEPLSLWIAGDSMVQFFGDTMVGMAEATGVIDATAESKLSSGLTRPDFYDWPARLADLVETEDPDVLVLMFGGNDAQGIVTPSGVAQPFSDAWVSEYSTRVGAVMDLVTANDARQVIWVGQPIMRSGEFDAKMQELNTIYRSEASVRDRVTYVDTRALFESPSGSYDRFIPDEDGDLVDVRLTDGVHLSTEGGRWLSRLLLDQLESLTELSPDAGS